MPVLPLVHPAIQDSPPSVPGFVQITDGDNHRLQYRDRLRDSKAHCLPRGLKGYPWRPQSFQRPCSQSQYRIVTGRTGVVEGWELDLESFASVKAFASRAESLDR